MAMIRAFPEDYSHFVSSLMLSDKLDKAIITQAFHTEQTQRVRRTAPQVSEVANKATHHLKKHHNKFSPNTSPPTPCLFCGSPSHCTRSVR